MRYFRLKLIILSIALFPLNAKDKGNVEYFISKTQEQFEKVNTYEVSMVIDVDVPGFRMPKRKYKAYFKQPNKVKIKSKGFGLLPKTGLFTSPQDNFDNLKNMVLLPSLKNNNIVRIKGDIIVDSLKLKMPNEYAKLSFRPTVTVNIDTSNWVINSIKTELDTLKLVEIINHYEKFNQYLMPSFSTVKYFVKDAKLSKWLKKDINTIVGQNPLGSKSDMVEGMINIKFKDYEINHDISNKIFKD